MTEHLDTTFALESLVNNTTYYWCIAAHDPYGNVSASKIWSFTTKASNPPSIPFNPSPADESNNVGLDATGGAIQLPQVTAGGRLDVSANGNIEDNAN